MRCAASASSSRRVPAAVARARLLIVPLLLLASAAPAGPRPGREGKIWSGRHVLFLDYQGGLTLQDRGEHLFRGGGVMCGHRGYTTYANLAGKRVIREDGRAVLEGSLPGGETRFTQTVSIDGRRVRVEVRRTGAWPKDVGWAGFQLGIPIARTKGCGCRADGEAVPYPDRLAGDGEIVSGAGRIDLCGGDPARNVTFESASGLGLNDHRRFKGYTFALSMSLNREGDEAADTLFITLPDAGPGSHGAVRFSPPGYPAKGPKSAVLEWPEGLPRPDDRVILERRGKGTVMEGRFEQAPDFLGFHHGVFDFSRIAEPGTYRLVRNGEPGPWFEVRERIFRGFWHDTLDAWLPWQMCHAKVVGKPRSLSHEACHLDDGIRVPAHFPGVDGFRSYGCEGTPYAAGDDVPCAIGGWHDAGDNDLNVSAQAHTVHRLALAWEEFGLDRDRATLDAEARTWTMSDPDGVPDLVQQVEWGVRWLLAMARPDGRIFVGVVHQPERYGASAAPEDTTDGKRGTGDERHVYVDEHADLQLKAAAAFHAASRALARHRPALAARCREAAEKAWAYFASRPETYRPTVYFNPPAGSRGIVHTKAAALAEAYLTTGSAERLAQLEAMAPEIAGLEVTWPSPRASGSGNHLYAPPFLARLSLAIPDGELKDACRAACRRSAAYVGGVLAARPWPSERWNFYSWGNSGSILNTVHDAYWLAKAETPGLDFALAVRCGLWMYGYHAVGDIALVCGAGERFPRFLYSSRVHAREGFAGGHVPGAVVPGIGGAADSRIVSYADDYGYYVFNEACIYTAAEHIFAMAALERAGY